MIETTMESTVPLDETEAFATLLGRIGRKATQIPAEVLVRHVLGIVPAHEWPVRVEAMEALLRRLESGHKDELRIEARPEEGKLLGLYATRRRGSESGPITPWSQASTRSGAVAIAPTSSRTRWGSASTS